MKRPVLRRFHLILVPVIPLVAGGIALATPALAANILTNPGFEAGNLNGWSCSLGSVVASPTCAVKSRPAGKVLQGYWENWDGAANGVHPPLGWLPITDARIKAHGYNVINAAFPVIRADGTVLWQDGMDVGVRVATSSQMCQAKAAGATRLMTWSINWDGSQGWTFGDNAKGVQGR